MVFRALTFAESLDLWSQFSTPPSGTQRKLVHEETCLIPILKHGVRWQTTPWVNP